MLSPINVSALQSLLVSFSTHFDIGLNIIHAGLLKILVIVTFLSSALRPGFLKYIQ